MRLPPLIARPIVLSLFPILTGCHISRAPCPGFSMAALALPAGGLLATHFLVLRCAKYARSTNRLIVS